MDFTPYIRDIADFPKPGIVFKDITPLLQDTLALTKACDTLCDF
ncbi:MAG: adenine phosphoribosyltransferase, partial [Bacteroidota bacterium]